jgi:hypothetical protein
LAQTPQSVCSTSDIKKAEKERQFAHGKEGDGAKSYDCEKAWSSINHSTLSDDRGTVRAVNEKAAGPLTDA